MAKISVFKVAPRKNDPPFNPYVYIFVSEYAKDSTGRIKLSPQLINDGEIDFHVNYLIKQLEKICKKAKSELIKSKEQLGNRKPK